MSLYIYLPKLYFILTSTEQCKQEDDEDLSLFVDKRRPSIAFLNPP